MTSRLRFLPAVAATAALAAALTVAVPLKGAWAAGPSDTLRVAEMWEVDNLDPARSGTFVKEKAMVAETLVDADPDFTLKPCLAVSWKRDGELDWTFQLRSGVLFHDGTPLTAAAVVESLSRAYEISPALKSMAQVDSVTAEGDAVVHFHTSAPAPMLPATLVRANLAIAAPNSEKTPEGVITLPIGTGPYKVAGWQRAARIVELERNGDYWGEDKPTIDKIVYRSVPDPSTRSLEIQKGDIDFVPDVPYGDLDMLAAKGLHTSRHITARVYQMAFGSVAEGPFADVRVRRAVSHAIDRAAIVDRVLFGMGQPAAGPFPESMAFAAKGLKVPAYDPKAAKALLAEAGWVEKGGVRQKDGTPFEVTLYTYPQRPGLPPMATAIQGMLGQIGIQASVKILDWSAILKKMRPQDMRIVASASAMYPDPDFFLRGHYYSKGNNNVWGYSNPHIDALFAKGLATSDPAGRKAAYDGIQKIVALEEPTILISYYGVNIVMKPEVKGFVFNPVAHDYSLGAGLRLDR